jgi:hypothetical protein
LGELLVAQLEMRNPHLPVIGVEFLLLQLLQMDELHPLAKVIGLCLRVRCHPTLDVRVIFGRQLNAWLDLAFLLQMRERQFTSSGEFAEVALHKTLSKGRQHDLGLLVESDKVDCNLIPVDNDDFVSRYGVFLTKILNIWVGVVEQPNH